MGLNKKSGFRGFVTVAPSDAAKRKAPQMPRELTQVPISHLEITQAQRQQIDAKYRHGATFSAEYQTDSDDDQTEAAALLAAVRLDLDARECLNNKWSIKWTGTGTHQEQRVLYQWCVTLASSPRDC